MADGFSLNCLDAEVCTDLVNHKSDGYSLDAENQNIKCEGVQNANGNGNDNDDEIFCTGVKDDLTTSCVETSEKEFNSRKRKRESLSGMVNWMRTIAKHPFDPLAQPLPEPSKWKEYKGGQDFFVQMLRARDVLSVRKHAEPNFGSSSKV
jgi:hypothetical protein